MSTIILLFAGGLVLGAFVVAATGNNQSTSNPLTFEEACAISKAIATADNFNLYGMDATMQMVQKAIAPWTSTTLANEAGRRLRSRVAAMKEAD